MHVGLHPAQKHGFGSCGEAAAAKRSPAINEPGCLGNKGCSTSGVKLKDLTQALAGAVIVKLKLSLNVSVPAVAKPAGLTAAEQAQGEIANALGTALNTPADDGSLPPAADVRAIAESALQESAKELQQVGASTNALTDAVNSLSSHLASLFDAFAALPGDKSDAITSAATSARLVTKEKGVLELRTREGDVVRISFGTRIDVKAQGAIASDGSNSYSELNVSAKVSGHSAISVEGDLNAEELTAIAAMVAKVDALANEFFAGNVDQAFAAAAALDLDDGPLAELALKLSMRQSYSESNVQSRQPLRAAASEPDDTALAQPVAPPRGSAPEAVVPEAAVEATDATAPAPPEAPAATPAPAPSIQLVIAKFMARSWAAFESDATSKLGFSVRMKFQLLAAAIEAVAPPEAKATDIGVAKLTDVANAVATAARDPARAGDPPASA